VRYEARVGDNHHHVVCRSCGAIADVDCAVRATPCLTTPDDHGFTIDEAEVIYWGQCPECLARRLIADTQASTQQGYTLSPEQPNVTSKQPSGGNGERKEMERRV
jgi:hypothetical protein